MTTLETLTANMKPIGSESTVRRSSRVHNLVFNSSRSGGRRQIGFRISKALVSAAGLAIGDRLEAFFDGDKGTGILVKSASSRSRVLSKSNPNSETGNIRFLSDYPTIAASLPCTSVLVVDGGIVFQFPEGTVFGPTPTTQLDMEV
jgi:hypothetical protein